MCIWNVFLNDQLQFEVRCNNSHPYGSNESSEKGSERKPSGFGEGSETNTKSSETGSGTSIEQGTSEKHIKIRFKCDFCEKTTKIALKNGVNIDWGNILFVYPMDVKRYDLE